MDIIEVAPKTKVNPFAADVAALVKASDANPGAAGAFKVPTLRDNGKDNVARTKFAIAKAANALDRTASLYETRTEGKNGETTVLVYQMKPKHAPRIRKNKNKAQETSAE